MGAWRWGRAGQPSAARPARGFKFRPCARVPRASRPPCEIRSGRRTRGWPRSSGSGHGFALSRRNPPELCFVALPLESRGHREGRVLTTHPRSAAQNAHAEEPHSSIQVVPITRPSLRDGRTAYAALSREPSSLWPPSPRRKSPAPRRLTRLPHSQGLDRSNDGQDHTVLPYARPVISPQFSRPCRRSRKLAGETKPGSAVRPRDAQGSRRAIRPAPAFRARRCRVHRKPGSRT